jgi:hypothetical protein
MVASEADQQAKPVKASEPPTGRGQRQAKPVKASEPPTGRGLRDSLFLYVQGVNADIENLAQDLEEAGDYRRRSIVSPALIFLGVLVVGVVTVLIGLHPERLDLEFFAKYWWLIIGGGVGGPFLVRGAKSVGRQVKARSARKRITSDAANVEDSNRPAA